MAGAQTGTGKTAAFALPILQRLSSDVRRPGPKACRALVLTPTRELAAQIRASFTSYGKHLKLTSTVIFGGVGQDRQVKALARGVDVLVATPGRLLDLMGQGLVRLAHIEVFVLDEADRMLDMGFIHDVRRVLAALPARRQSLFFSATMLPEVVRLAGSILNDPVKVEAHPVASTSEALRVIERYTMLDADTIRYEATMEDQKVFTRPWKISMPLYRRRDPNMQLMEDKCVPFTEELLYGHLRKKP